MLFRINPTLKKCVCIVMCMCVLVASAVVSGQRSPLVMVASAAKTKAQLEAEKKALEKKKADKVAQINADKKKITELSGKLATANEKKNAIDKLIANNRALINICNDELSLIKQQVSDLDANIKKNNDKIESDKELFKTRIRTMYMNGSYSSLEILMGAEGLSDLLLKTELMRKVSEHDSQLISELNEAVKELNDDKAEVTAKKAEQDEIKKTLSARQADLNSQYKQAASLSNEIASAKGSVEADRNKAQKDANKIDAEIENVNDAMREIDNYNKSGPISNIKELIFAWPSPDCYNVTSEFGYRWGRQHKGMDISRSRMNDRIVAAADGVVTKASDTGNGYGKCVIINHGRLEKNGIIYSTLYGHNNVILVSVGQKVTKGQLIAKMGNTGRVSGVTGIHLHFEIWENSTPVNPRKYF